MSHLTTEEIEALQTSKLPRDTPHLIVHEACQRWPWLEDMEAPE